MTGSEHDDDKTQTHVILTKGTMVSHYRIVEKIGAGGMGEVFLAEDTLLDRKVALKFLPPHSSQDEAARARFTREARAAAKLDHPNIAPVYEVGEFEGRPFFAMAHIEGKSLRTVIKEDKLAVSEVVRLTTQICEGLHKAHEVGVVHRDIKPGNIIIDSDNRPRIVDFGLASLTGEEKLTKTGSTLGTVGYMSPEQIEGKQVDCRSDLFSVGVILYEMLTGRRPFKGETDVAVARSITDNTPEPIARFKSGTTGELQRIIDKALAKDVSLRYQHADGIISDLKRLEIGSTEPKRSRVGLWAAIALAVVLVAYFSINRWVLSDDDTAEGWTDSIAVLVFRDLSPDQDQAYFCEGMTEEIIGRLSSIRQLKVTSLQSMLRFKDTEQSLRQIGKELGVANILEGSVHKDGDSIRVRAQLIRVDDDSHIWSDRYIREVRSVLAVQDEISQSIASVMQVTLGGLDDAPASKHGTDNIDAYNAHMRGRYFWRKRTEEGLETSREYFREAISLDSSYALAYCGLADSWISSPAYSNVTEREAYPKALEAVSRALALNNELAECHATRGQVLYRMGEWDEAEKEYLRSIELNPNYPWAHIWYATLLNNQGRKELRRKHLDIALELDPLSLPVLTELSRDYWEAGDIEKMKELSDLRIEIEPSYQSAYIELSYMYVRIGDTTAALSTVSRFVDNCPDYWLSHTAQGWNYGTYGMHEKARAAFDKALAIAPDLWKTHFWYGTYLLEKAKRRDEAEPYLLHAIDIDSNQYEPYQKYGKLLSETGRIEQAEEYFQHAVELAPYQVNPLIEYAWFLSWAQGRHDESIAMFERAIELNPYNSQTFNSVAEVYKNVGDTEKAIRAMNKAVELSPGIYGFLRRQAKLFVLAGEFDSALASYKEYLNHIPGDRRAQWEIASCYTFTGRYRESDSIYAYFTKHEDSRQRSWGWYYRSIPLRRQGRLREAIEVLKTGIENDKEEAGDSTSLMWKYYHIGRLYLDYLSKPELAMAFADSAEMIHQALGAKDEFWTSRILGAKAEALALLGELTGAGNLLRKERADLDSAQAELLNASYGNLSVVLRIAGEYDSSLVLAERAYTPLSHFWIALNLGRSCLETGRTNRAVEVLERAMSRFDDNRIYYPERSVMGHYYLARAYETAGRTDDAIVQYETFLNIWGNADEGLESVEDARTGLARLKETI